MENYILRKYENTDYEFVKELIKFLTKIKFEKTLKVG